MATGSDKSRKRRAPPISYRAGIDAVLHGAALPYGYTITIWGSGQALIHQQGKPGIGLVFLFAAGAAAAFGLLQMATHGRAPAPHVQLAGSSHPVRAGALHLASIGAALGAATLVGGISSGVAWPLGGFAATLVYLGVAAVELAMLERDASGDGS